ncbi:S9 family peptidase [Alteriqipengyuania flavescens]|uniref:alpha/beta hydrolase family protein n=1 Tax=Alteriqipengyuania flavescens TaxID=3053610 RepID=UPI0025B2A213|nr:S9 family peptidase [Alteriqipengyuania flavescens]WJY19609.1 S9 family peptidase [Alteriqipengyuania flavescens]WJY25549.1 S9 family peptidase [Alteriqipengyuania flavescens]
MKTFLSSAAVALALTAALAASPAYADDHDDDPRPMTALDLVTAPRLGSPVVSADGAMLWTVTTTDPESFARSTAIHYVPTGGDTDAPMTLNFAGDASSFEFAPDGSVYFLSSRMEGRSQLFHAVLGSDGVSAIHQVSRVDGEVAGFDLSGDGSKVVLMGTFSRECATFGCGTPATSLPGPGTGRLYDGEGGFYRHWDGWEQSGIYNRAFAFPIANVVTGAGTPLDGPAGDGALVANTPTMPFGGGEDIAWAADGGSVFFAGRVSDGGEPASTNVDIYRTDLATGAVRNLTDANDATDTMPAPSPDGRYLAYLAMARPGYESDRLVVQLHDLATGETRALTQDFDRSFHSLNWTPDSRWIVATAGDVLDDPAFRIDPRSGEVTRLDLVEGNEARIGVAAILPGNRIVFTRNSVAAPSEIYLSDGWQGSRRLTDVTASDFEALAQVETTRFNFAGAGGDTVWGMIHKPAWVEGPLPVVLYVHGGPQGSFNDGWSSRWNPRVVASQGYAVVSIDFHGSTGYGQAFTDSINRDWGGKPLEDLQLGLAAALAGDSQLDGTRACAMGASYGGYMMNWIAGNWADRFDCLVQHDGLFDMRSFYYTTEELWFPKWDFGGSYSEQKALYERWNPVNYVDNWQTPMLVITGEMDFRVPYTQGLASFTALQERGIDSQLLVFPDENHWVLKPKNSLQWHNTVFDWLDKHLSQ